MKGKLNEIRLSRPYFLHDLIVCIKFSAVNTKTGFEILNIHIIYNI